MPRLSLVRKILCGLSLGVVLTSPAAMAQTAPTDIPGVLVVCAPVIAEEYEGNDIRWGQCVAAVDGFLTYIGAPSDDTNAVVADLVAELVKLYQELRCPDEETELPQAIELAAQKTTDEVQVTQILEISATIKDCVAFATAAIPLTPVPASAF